MPIGVSTIAAVKPKTDPVMTLLTVVLEWSPAIDNSTSMAIGAIAIITIAPSLMGNRCMCLTNGYAINPSVNDA